MKWFTTFGQVEVVEQVLRLGRRGVELRPFCQRAGVQHRSYSRPLQRVLTDFGAEASFARAAERVKEHYRIEVPVSAVRKQTLAHGRKMSGLWFKHPGPAPGQIITEMDGSMVPVMQPGKGPDGRKGKTLLWREARLCLARGVEQTHGFYGATMGTADIAAGVWRETALQAGLHDKAFVHGVGDGAPWILDRPAGTLSDRLLPRQRVSGRGGPDGGGQGKGAPLAAAAARQTVKQSVGKGAQEHGATSGSSGRGRNPRAGRLPVFERTPAPLGLRGGTPPQTPHRFRRD